MKFSMTSSSLLSKDSHTYILSLASSNPFKVDSKDNYASSPKEQKNQQYRQSAEIVHKILPKWKWEIVFFAYTIANTVTMGFVGKSMGGGNRTILYMIIGATMWSYLSVLFEVLAETVAWERWEGTIEYTFISPEKGVQVVHIFQAFILMVSGVYYSVSVMPKWMEMLSYFSPAAYALEAMRKTVLNGEGMWAIMDKLVPMVLMGVILLPLGFFIFKWGKRFSKRRGFLKRNG